MRCLIDNLKEVGSLLCGVDTDAFQPSRVYCHGHRGSGATQARVREAGFGRNLEVEPAGYV